MKNALPDTFVAPLMHAVRTDGGFCSGGRDFDGSDEIRGMGTKVGIAGNKGNATGAEIQFEQVQISLE